VQSIGGARVFLDDMKIHLASIPLAEAKDFRSEGAFCKQRVVPQVHSFLLKEGYSKEQAKQALLAEGYDTNELRQLSSGTPASKRKYAFKKGVTRTLRTARTEWWRKGKGLYHSCPDFAFLSPDFNIVFEGKLFRGGGVQRARTEIVDGVFECAFYRGLPTLLSR
jgi:hypothetical protein